MPKSVKKIKSVIELARYKADEIAYWVPMRAVGQNSVEIPPGEEWMAEHHPKVLHERKLNNTWKPSVKLPKLHHIDFNIITTLLTSRFVVETFTISEIYRSMDTGEFFYSNHSGEWMPESYLFDTEVAARRERDRILKLIKKWATDG